MVHWRCVQNTCDEVSIAIRLMLLSPLLMQPLAHLKWLLSWLDNLSLDFRLRCPFRHDSGTESQWLLVCSSEQCILVTKSNIQSESPTLCPPPDPNERQGGCSTLPSPLQPHSTVLDYPALSNLIELATKQDSVPSQRSYSPGHHATQFPSQARSPSPAPTPHSRCLSATPIPLLSSAQSDSKHCPSLEGSRTRPVPGDWLCTF